MALLTGAFIAVFFVTWELLEFTLMSDMPESTRKWLHISRGILGAACIGVITAVLVRRQERRLAQMRQALIQSEKLATIGQMAAGIAHEVGNPLASISSVIQLLERGGLPDSDKKRMKLIHDELDRINRIVRQLVDFSRPAPVKQTELSLQEVLADAVDLARYDPRARSVRFDLQFPSVPPPVKAVREHLVQVFLNVMYNGMDAMSDGGVLMIRCRSAGDEVFIDFKDSGVGIPADRLEKVFQPFFTTKPHGRGSGLGLAVTRHLLSQLNGRITLDSEPGNGTSVCIVLPSALSQPLQRGTQVYATQAATPEGSGSDD